MKKLFTETIDIDTYSCDSNDIIKASGIFQVCQECGRKQMAAQRPSYKELLDDGKAMMLSRIDMAAYDRINIGDEVVIATWPCESSRATFLRMYQIKRDDKVVAEISSQWVLVEITSRKILKVSDVDFSNYYMGEYHEVIGDKFKVPKDMEFETVGTKEIMYSDLDSNRHMNNTYYLDVISNYVPELCAGTHRVEKARIHFAKEAPFGDTITITRCKTGDGKYLFRTLKESGEKNIDAEITVTEI